MWIVFALLNPVFDASRNVFSKKASETVDPIIISWFNNLLPALVTLPLLLFTDLTFNNKFWISLIITGSLNIIAIILYHKSIASGEISIVIPLLSFTPLFLLLSSPLITGEFPGSKGLLGVFLIVAGSYFLNSGGLKSGFKPFKLLFKNKGSFYMLLVALIYSISSNYDKIAIQHSSIVQFIAFVNIYVFTGVSLVLIFSKKLKVEEISSQRRNLLLLSLFTALGYFAHMIALSMTLVVYVIALKRTSAMISVVFGRIIFNEKETGRRIFASVLMLLGTLSIVL